MNRKSSRILFVLIVMVTMVAALTTSADTCIDAKFIWDPYSPCAGDTVTFDASISTCNWEGDNVTGHYVPLVSYEWDFGDETTGEGETATHTYPKKGTYDVTLVIMDAAGDNDTFKIPLTVELGSSSDGDSNGFPLWIVIVVVAAGIGIVLSVYFAKVKRPK